MTDRQIYEACLKLKPQDRSAYIDEACGTDAALRQHVEYLLNLQNSSLGLLEKPTVDESQPDTGTQAYVPSASHDVSPGTTIAGRYKIMQELGEGGMGTVYVAEQREPVKRQVALKLIKTGMNSKVVLTRFEAERQALALMDHPNIAKMLDGGITDNGQPYFVMELVKGVPINKFCDQEHLTPKERLELFIPVCQAVQHAHQKGIIHRDLKPSNILVGLYDGKPVAKVIDFGVAKAVHQKLTERTMYTEVGSIIGTLEYMAPEQAELNILDIDTRADIYALGVILYELLTGSTPFSSKQLRGAAFDEMLRMIREVEPPKPSTKISTSEALPNIAAKRKLEPKRLTAMVTGELDWIVMKCLEKDRSRRYETANGLAGDIQRYLSDEPVQAGPPSARYRLSKFMQRNRLRVIAAGVVLLALAGGIIGTSIGLWRAEQSATKEKEAKEQAENRLTQVKRGNELLLSIFTDLNMVAVRKGTDPLERVLAKRLIKVADTLEGDALGNEIDVAYLQYRFGLALNSLDFPSDAIPFFIKARTTFTEKLGGDHVKTLAVMVDLATSYGKLGQFQDELKLCKEILPLRIAKLGRDDPDTFASTVNLANAYASLGFQRESVVIYEELLPRMKASMPDSAFTINCMNNLAAGYLGQRRFDESLKLFQETLALRKAKQGNDHQNTLACMNNIAAVYSNLNRHEESLKLHEEVLALRKIKLGLDHPDTLSSTNNVALQLAKLRKHDLAIKFYEEAISRYKSTVGPDYIGLLGAMVNLGKSYTALRQYQDALKVLQDVMPRFLAKYPGHRFTLNCLIDLSQLYVTLNRPQDAIKLLEEALPIFEKQLGTEHANTMRTSSLIARSYVDCGRKDEAALLAAALEERNAKIKIKDIQVNYDLYYIYSHLPASPEALNNTLRHCDIILKATCMEMYMINYLKGSNNDQQKSQARLQNIVDQSKGFKFVNAAAKISLAGLTDDPEDKKKLLEEVLSNNDPELAAYQAQAKDKLKQFDPKLPAK